MERTGIQKQLDSPKEFLINTTQFYSFTLSRNFHHTCYPWMKLTSIYTITFVCLQTCKDAKFQLKELGELILSAILLLIISLFKQTVCGT